MGKTLVLIVSEQTAPNLLFIKSNPDAEKFVFITTEKMEKGQKTYWILKSIGKTSEDPDIKSILVPEEDISQIQKNSRKGFLLTAKMKFLSI